MKKLHIIAWIFATFFAFAISGCDREGPAERAGEGIDETTEETRDQMEDTREESQERTEESREATGE